ncbi:DUF6301 family protein [Nocardia sp. NPDC052001]|uniref:DUF6301 family protein n=1 Tax=Nocardia sp. NPDC052001 TaxID=3154853 RepID=UPI003420B2D6
MQADIERAQEIVRMGADLDWVWSVDDIDRFCSNTGWTVTKRFESGGSLATDLSVAAPSARFLVDGGVLNYLSFTVVETDDGAQLSDSFADLGRRMVTVLGAASWRNRGEQPKARWDLPNVVVFLGCLRAAIFVKLVRPEYQREEDYIDEVVIPWIDANPQEGE